MAGVILHVILQAWIFIFLSWKVIWGQICIFSKIFIFPKLCLEGKCEKFLLFSSLSKINIKRSTGVILLSHVIWMTALGRKWRHHELRGRKIALGNFIACWSRAVGRCGHIWRESLLCSILMSHHLLSHHLLLLRHHLLSHHLLNHHFLLLDHWLVGWFRVRTESNIISIRIWLWWTWNFARIIRLWFRFDEARKLS